MLLSTLPHGLQSAEKFENAAVPDAPQVLHVLPLAPAMAARMTTRAASAAGKTKLRAAAWKRAGIPHLGPLNMIMNKGKSSSTTASMINKAQQCLEMQTCG